MCGKSLHEKFILVRESAKELQSKKINNVLVKIEIAKAFDTVNWQFRIQILMKIGFGDRWIHWIEVLLSSASTNSPQ